MDDIIASLAVQQAIANWIAGSTGPFENSTIHLFKNDNTTISNLSVLGDFQESTFQGYAAISGQSPIAVFLDITNRWRVKFDAVEWQVADGVPQAGTITVSTAVTMTGTLIVTVTAAGMTGSPRAVTVNVVSADSVTVAAQKIAAALNGDTDVSSFFVATSALGVVTLTRLVGAAEDSTMNMALALGTATGPAPVATWTQTQAGVAPVAPDETAFGVFLTDSSGTQYRGAALFAEPFPLTRAFQDVNSWPDFPYGG